MKFYEKNDQRKRRNKLVKSYNENQKLFYGALKQMRKPRVNILQNIRDADETPLMEEVHIMESWKYWLLNNRLRNKLNTMEISKNC